MTPGCTRRVVLRLGLAIPLALAGCAGSRQEDVALRGAQVMPFDLEKTTHRFIPQDDGLLEEVVADDPADSEQIRLIRDHLKREAERFREGDFSDPERIHGDKMPGLRELTEGIDRIEITYRPVATGGSIRFRTRDPKLVNALHAWGEAQTSDHGSHAE